jgi:hypothetical protein
MANIPKATGFTVLRIGDALFCVRIPVASFFATLNPNCIAGVRCKIRSETLWTLKSIVNTSVVKAIPMEIQRTSWKTLLNTDA